MSEVDQKRTRAFIAADTTIDRRGDPMPHSQTTSISQQPMKELDSAAYESWFKAEVEAGLREADDPAIRWYSQEEIEQESEQQIAAWRSRVQGGAKID
jgi:hypothetical protein